jgi:hypothetical protein
MAMRAVLVEQAAPGGNPVGVALVRVFGNYRRIVRARISRRTGQTKEDGEHAHPREGRRRDFRGEY